KLYQKCRFYTSGRLDYKPSFSLVPDTEHHAPLSQLPMNCPGCGAFTQNLDPGAAGFYSATRTMKLFRSQGNAFRTHKSGEETKIFQTALANADEDVLKGLGLDLGSISAGRSSKCLVNYSRITNQYSDAQPKPAAPFCDRCHNLQHHNSGVSIHHPSIQAIRQTIWESPHKHNHIYHVLDAADFPL